MATAFTLYERVCGQCNISKPFDAFGIQKSGRLGRRAECKKCRNSKQRYAYNTDGTTRIAHVNRRFRSTYGVEIEEASAQLKKQNGRCAICSVELEFENTGNKAQIDHNHETNIPRGILCCRCNWGIGQFKENIKIMKKAIEYIITDGVWLP